MLLYIHVPFCRTKCSYCGFFSLPLDSAGKSDAGRSLIADWLLGVSSEMQLWSMRLGKVKVSSLFFGGGTPSLLPAAVIGRLIDQARSVFSFASKVEISMEANPESILQNQKLADLKKAGINRLSLGVQSFDDASLQLLGRPHTAHDALLAVDAARAAGFTNLNLDLIWGLPRQTLPQWLGTLKRATDLQPEHISAYGLTLEDGSPLTLACERKEFTLPEEAVQADMFTAGAEFLEAHGYIQYEISNFSRMGCECAHNIGYWEGENYLGLGPSATSTLGARRWTNSLNLAVWKESVAKGTIGSDFEVLDHKTKLQEKLMLQLRMSKGILLAEWEKMSGTSLLKTHTPLIASLQQHGLAVVRNKRFRLTRAGMLVSNSILARFFEDSL